MAFCNSLEHIKDQISRVIDHSPIGVIPKHAVRNNIVPDSFTNVFGDYEKLIDHINIEANNNSMTFFSYLMTFLSENLIIELTLPQAFYDAYQDVNAIAISYKLLSGNVAFKDALIDEAFIRMITITADDDIIHPDAYGLDMSRVKKEDIRTETFLYFVLKMGQDQMAYYYKTLLFTLLRQGVEYMLLSDSPFTPIPKNTGVNVYDFCYNDNFSEANHAWILNKAIKFLLGEKDLAMYKLLSNNDFEGRYIGHITKRFNYESQEINQKLMHSSSMYVTQVQVNELDRNISELLMNCFFIQSDRDLNFKILSRLTQ
jgi:hypothetical protein